jgi:hypothetical protein
MHPLAEKKSHQEKCKRLDVNDPERFRHLSTQHPWYLDSGDANPNF